MLGGMIMNTKVTLNEYPEETDTGFTLLGRIVAMIKAVIKMLFGDIPTAL